MTWQKILGTQLNLALDHLIVMKNIVMATWMPDCKTHKTWSLLYTEVPMAVLPVNEANLPLDHLLVLKKAIMAWTLDPNPLKNWSLLYTTVALPMD